MSYKFSQAAGRLVGSTKSLAQGLKPAGPESSKIIYSHDVKFPTVNNASQSRHSSGSSKVSPVNKKLLENYARFQKDDGVPVHLKAGMRDKVLYYTTIALAGVGLAEMFRNFYHMAFPKKAEE